MNPKTEYVNLAASDGTSLRAYVAHPEGRPKAGLLVFQEAFGVNAHIRDVTERFAREGYLSISPELFHRSAPGFEAGYTNFAEVVPHMQALTDAGLAADIQAAFQWLKNGEAKDLPVGSTGYCMGGRTSIHAALTVPLQGSVSYYGGGIAPGGMFPSLTDRLKDLKAPTLFFWGGLDAHIGLDAVQAVTKALDEAKKDYANVVFSKADHGFFCDARASYNAVAAKQAWALTLEFFNQHLAR
ncbi:MAG: dienelactone hydrolase family protein [Bryobacteraceae bacterium]